MTDKQNALTMAKTAKGQIESVIKMLEDDRYCVDISNQILAVYSLLRKTNTLVLRHHMNACVKDAFLNGSGAQHVDEMMKLFDKIQR
jgi:CsoR family transcriptional regulator, copper-sensing transcriptional repressor